jgi:Fe-S-cluster containining protein
MLHDGGQLERQRARDFRDGKARLSFQTSEDGPPGRIYQRGKSTIELTDWTLHHVVNYRDSTDSVKDFCAILFSAARCQKFAVRATKPNVELKKEFRVDDIDFECTACGKCCNDLRLPLTLAEASDWLARGGQMELICEAIPWPADPEPPNPQADYRKARSTPAESGSLPVRVSIILAAAFAGPCPYLRADMLCGIYEERPLVCRIYPAEINPFVSLTPANKACPPEAWNTKPLQRHGVLVDETTRRLIELSRRTAENEAPLRMRLCHELSITHASLANEGFVIHAPRSSELLAALERIRATPDVPPAPAEWTFVSNRGVTVETLLSVGAAVRLDEPVDARDFRYHGFHEASSA